MIFDSFPIPPNRSNFFYLKQIWIRSAFFTILCLSLWFLSRSLLIQFIFYLFFCLILGQRFKGFLLNPKVRHFCPFFFYQITCIHAFFKKFRINKKLGFLLILCILIKSDSWVFVHASFKHDPHALISKFSWFIKIFEIRILMFLRDLRILWNWAKLSKIGLWYCLIKWL